MTGSEGRQPRDTAVVLSSFVLSLSVHGALLLSTGERTAPASFDGGTEIVVDLRELPSGREPVLVAAPVSPEESPPKPELPPATAVQSEREIPADPAEKLAPHDPSRSLSIAQGPLRDGNKQEAYYAMISARIEESKEYPPVARRRRQEAQVVIVFTLNRQGMIIDGPRFREASRHELLNEAAMRAILRSVPFPAFDEAVGPENLTFVVPIHFEARP